MPRAWQSLIPVSWLPLIEKSASGSRALYSEELIALTGDYRVARAAYEEASSSGRADFATEDEAIS